MMSPTGNPATNRRTRRSLAIAPLIGGLLLALVGCGAAGGAGPSSGAAPGSGDRRPDTPMNAPADPAGAVRLTTDRSRYRPGEPMHLRFHNGSASEVQLSGGLGGLRGWRLVGDRQEPWDHSLAETTVLVPVAPGKTVELGPVPAPQEPGRYRLEVHYHGPSGPETVTVDIDVEG